MASNIHVYWKPVVPLSPTWIADISQFYGFGRIHHCTGLQLSCFCCQCSAAVQLSSCTIGHLSMETISSSECHHLKGTVFCWEREVHPAILSFFLPRVRVAGTPKCPNGCTLPTLPPFLFLIACGPFGFTHPPLQPCHTTARHQKVFSAPFRWIGWKLQA